MGDTSTSSSTGSALWTKSSSGEVAHPASPRGAGGNGGFALPRPLDAHANQPGGLPHPSSPAAKNVVPQFTSKRSLTQSAQPLGVKKTGQFTLVIGINPSATNKWGNVDTGTNPGHTIVALKNSEGKLEKVFSYGPQRHSQQIACSFPAQTNYPLDKTDTYTIFEFSITEDQRKKALEKMKEIEDNPGTFDAADQCTTKSLDVVRAAGLSVPDGRGGVVVYFCPDPGKVPTPVNLDKDLLKQFPDAKQVPATYFSGFVQFK